MKNNKKKQEFLEQLIDIRLKKILKEDYNVDSIDEISLSGLKNVGNKIIQKGKDGVNAAVDALDAGIQAGVDKVGLTPAINKIDSVATKIGSGIRKEYEKGQKVDLEKKIEDRLQNIKDAIIAYNELAKKNGEPLINPRKYMGYLNSIPVLKEDEVPLEEAEGDQKEFIVKVKHDKGTASLKVLGTDEADVKKKVMAAEGCPEGAIVSVKPKVTMEEDVNLETLRGLDFEYIEDYYDYIKESIINGQFKQAKALYDDLSDVQKEEFEGYMFDDGDDKESIMKYLK